GTANATQFASFSITPIGTPFGPLRFAVLTPAVLLTTPLTAGFAPGPQLMLQGVTTTQNIAPGFSALPAVTGTTTLAPGFPPFAATTPAATANIAPGFSQVIATPFTGNIAPGFNPGPGMSTVNISTGFNQSLTTSGTGFGSIIPTPIIAS